MQKDKFKKKYSDYDYVILIAEDNEINRIYLDALLELFDLNIKVLYVKNGVESVEMCRENSEIGFVLTDMEMPVMNGFDATRLIKKFRPNLNIVAQTAHSVNEEITAATMAGCDDFISKPISKEIFSAIIDKYLIKSR